MEEGEEGEEGEGDGEKTYFREICFSNFPKIPETSSSAFNILDAFYSDIACTVISEETKPSIMSTECNVMDDEGYSYRYLCFES